MENREKERAGRNRTLHLTQGAEREYMGKCIDGNNDFGDGQILDKTIAGDCFNVLPKLPKNFVDLLIVDPPYNMDKKFGGSRFHKMESSEYESFTRRWIESVLPSLKKTATVYVCCDWRTSIIISSVIGDYFIIQNRITWQREKGRGALTNWKNSMEDIWFATLSGNYTFNVDDVKQRRKVIAPYRIGGIPKDWEETENGNYRDTYPSNFWDDVTVPYWSMPENTDHPTQKPEKLYAKLILASSNKGDIILDPFAGVGTASVVAKKLKRHFIGIEKEPEYCALIEKRLEMAELDNTIQGYSDNVFWERNSLAQQKKDSQKQRNNTTFLEKQYILFREESYVQ